MFKNLNWTEWVYEKKGNIMCSFIYLSLNSAFPQCLGGPQLKYMPLMDRLSYVKTWRFHVFKCLCIQMPNIVLDCHDPGLCLWKMWLSLCFYNCIYKAEFRFVKQTNWAFDDMMDNCPIHIHLNADGAIGLDFTGHTAKSIRARNVITENKHLFIHVILMQFPFHTVQGSLLSPCPLPSGNTLLFSLAFLSTLFISAHLPCPSLCCCL